MEFKHILAPKDRPPVLGAIRDALTNTWGPNFGWGILNQQILEGKAAEIIVNAIKTRPNSLNEYQVHLETYFLEEALLEREQAKKGKKRKVQLVLKPQVLIEEPEESAPSKKEESVHTKAQGELIALGKITGCSVWIASNDQSKKYKGKALSEGCLNKLPSLGLSDEATKRIALIDVIWIKQNNPVCAFEVEATSSVYSGLLRMSDLLSLVPALNMRLYVVAHKDRQDKVMKELARPTFQKIGLSEYCRFVSTEDLDDLLQKVEGFGGHVQASVIDTIAVELEAYEGSNETP